MKKYLGFIITVLLLALIPLTLAESATLEVDNIDPACDDTIGLPYCTIQAAIDAATAGDTISVATGTYDSEPITIDKDLALRGAGDSLTIIEWPNGTVVTISDPAVTTQISDVTIQFGFGGNGGGIYNVGTLLLENSRVANNEALDDYGGPTETHNLADDSPAIDAGDPAGCQGDIDGNGMLDGVISVDQRGNIRVEVPNVGNAGPSCDVGAVEYNLVLNGMFEDDKDADQFPDLWQALNLSPSDKFVCNKKAVHSGECAFKVNGKNATTKEVFQVISRAGAINDPYELVVYSASRNAAMMSLDIVVRFEDTVGGMVTDVPFPITTGTHGYQRFVSLVVAPHAYDVITVFAIRSTMTPAGRVFIDDVSLVPG